MIFFEIHAKFFDLLSLISWVDLQFSEKVFDLLGWPIFFELPGAL